MRSYITVLTLLALCACGGDDITTPPEAGQFSLTVSGSGSGAGHVTTSPAATPAVDCALNPNGATGGVCSGNYAEGTPVNVVIAPATGSSFAGWAGDAQGCGTQLTCALTMTGNMTAVAQLSTGTGLQITSSAFYANFNEEGTVVWVAEVQNPTSQTVELAEINFTSHDASGAVLASDLTFVGPIPPGETRAAQSFADYTGTESSVDIQLGQASFTDADPGLSVAQITSSNWHADPVQGGVVWTVEVQNTSAAELELVAVNLVTYDANGKIIAVDLAFVGPIPAGETRSGEGFADLHGNEANAKFQVVSVG
jgi:hypothetical protein